MPKKKVLIEIDADVWRKFKVVALKGNYTVSEGVERALKQFI